MTLPTEYASPPLTDTTSTSTTNTGPLDVIVIGATGAVGKWIVYELLANPLINHVYAFVRRANSIKTVAYDNEKTQLKLTEIIFELSTFTHEFLKHHWPQVPISAVFSGLGTTIKQAGTKEAFYAVDYTANYILAQFAKEKGVQQYHLISSVGANSQSSVFYTQTKGKLEEAVKELGIQLTIIYRPGFLANSERTEFRCGECCVGWVLTYMCCCFTNNCFSKWRGADVHKIAIAVVHECVVNSKNNSNKIIIIDGSTNILHIAELEQEESQDYLDGSV